LCACGNTIQENRHHVICQSTKGIRSPSCPVDRKIESVHQLCQPGNRRGSQYQVGWDLRIGCSGRIAPRGENIGPHPNLHKVVSLIYTPITTYPFVITKRTGIRVSQVADEVLYTGLIEMQELDAPG